MFGAPMHEGLRPPSNAGRNPCMPEYGWGGPASETGRRRLGGSRRGAFSLIEVLLAMSIAGIVMTAVCAMLFNMVSIMESFENDNPFVSHVDRVEKFLTSRIAASRFAGAADTDLRGTALSQDLNISYSRPPDANTSDNLRLCFGVSDDHPLFVSSKSITSEKVCWLDLSEDEGLSLLWCFARKEDTLMEDSERPVYRTKISPYVKSIEYLYYYADGFGWTWETEIKEGSDAAKQLPTLIKLEFEHGTEKAVRFIPVFGIADTTFYKPSSYKSAEGGGSSGGGGK